jgi:hypothetical protein
MRIIPRVTSQAARLAGAALLAAVTLTGVLATPASAGPIGLQAAAGWYTESDEAFANVGAKFGLGTISLIPNVDWVFVSSGSTYSLNVDGTMSIMPLGVASVYAGAGLGWLTYDPGQGSSDTQTVINLLIGASLNAVPMKPFGQFKYIVADGNDPLTFSIGVSF